MAYRISFLKVLLCFRQTSTRKATTASIDKEKKILINALLFKKKNIRQRKEQLPLLENEEFIVQWFSSSKMYMRRGEELYHRPAGEDAWRAFVFSSSQRRGMESFCTLVQPGERLGELLFPRSARRDAWRTYVPSSKQERRLENFIPSQPGETLGEHLYPVQPGRRVQFCAAVATTGPPPPPSPSCCSH